MISYSVPMRDAILDGRKSETTRLWPNGCKVKEGSVHNMVCPTRFGERFGTHRIEKVYRAMLQAHPSDERAWREGFSSWDAFMAFVHQLYDKPYPNIGGEKWNPKVWIVKFLVVTFVIDGEDVDAGEYLERELG